MPTTLDEYRTSITHDGRPHEVVIKRFDVLKCSSCGNVALTEDGSDRVTDALRAAAGLLQPAEIRSKREALGLTQKQLAAAIRIAESTLSRWESGAQIQQRAMDLLLRAYFDLGPFREYTRQTIAAPAEALVSA
jgi:putative zinc finger/helix-turn-helix YgiT family protein